MIVLLPSIILGLCHTGRASWLDTADIAEKPRNARGVPDSLLIHTTSGQIMGEKIEYEGVSVHRWLGVPFAKPPVGDLRFRPPQPIEAWSGIKYTTQQPPMCAQAKYSIMNALENSHLWLPSGDMSEDCLYLNIYVPVKPSTSSQLSTIVWIYPGAFQTGSINMDMFDPVVLAAKHGVIVVSVQYRLSALGFLYLGTPEIPGNMGLMDQAEGIKWVSLNIEQFGGNKGDITLMGESAGSGSVGYHLLSNMTKGLFQRAIMQSGSPFNSWAFSSQSEMMGKSKEFAFYAGCMKPTLAWRADCLRRASLDRILRSDLLPVPLTPTVDGTFMKMSPEEAISREDFIGKPILGGLVQNEGAPAVLFNLKMMTKFTPEDFGPYEYQKTCSLVFTFFDVPETERVKIMSGYREYFTDEKTHETNYFRAISQLVGDLSIGCGSSEFLTKVHKGHDLYRYAFNHRSSKDNESIYTEVMHSSDVPYVFGLPLRHEQDYNDVDKELSTTVMEYWTKFAKTGAPGGSWTNYVTDKDIMELRGLNDITTVRNSNYLCTLIPNYKEAISINNLGVFINEVLKSTQNINVGPTLARLLFSAENLLKASGVIDPLPKMRNMFS